MGWKTTGWRGIAVGLALALGCSVGPHGASAQAAAPTAPVGALAESANARANAGTVGVISGGVDGTYIRIANDLSAVLDDGDRMRVLALIGKGSMKNLADILLLRGIDIGIVQSDVLAYARRERTMPGIDQAIQYIAKLYDEEVHVLARPETARLEDLAGKKVNVDVRGSGTAITAALMFEYLHIAMKPTYDDQETALEKLKTGEIDALIYVAGKPARLFSGLDTASGLHFVAVPMSPALLETYLPTSLGSDSYPGLIPAGSEVETLAVGAVMAVYGWQPGTDRYNRVARFVVDFFEKFPAFLKPPRHPKWKEVNIAASVPGWNRFPPAQDWLNRQSNRPTAANQRAEFDAFVIRSGGIRSTMPEAERVALFQKFMEWQKHSSVTP